MTEQSSHADDPGGKPRFWVDARAMLEAMRDMTPEQAGRHLQDIAAGRIRPPYVLWFDPYAAGFANEH